MGLSKFWQDRRAEFKEYHQRFPDLRANWYAPGHHWWFQDGESRNGISNPNKEAVKVFKALAKTIVAGPTLRKEISSYPGVSSYAEPWAVWLDYMRVRKWAFVETRNHLCTEHEWDAGVKDGKPLDTVRAELRYTTGDEWDKVYQRTRNGKLRRLSAKELEGKSNDDLQKYYHCLQDGMIEHVFGSSETFCVELAADCTETETVGSVSKPANHASAGSVYGARMAELFATGSNEVDNIEAHRNALRAALDKDKRDEAVQLWQRIRSMRGLKYSHVALFTEADQDKSEFYKWKRGKHSRGSRPDNDIRRVLLQEASQAA